MAAEPTLCYPCCEHCGDPYHSGPCGRPGCPGRIPFELELEG